MGRGGRARERDGPRRRCIAAGESGPTDRLVRFVLSPDGRVVPDLAHKLPGRGAWLTAERALVDRAVDKGLFSRAFRRPAEALPDLADRLEDLLARRLVETISLARKAGRAVVGAGAVRARLESGSAAVLLQASDGAPGGKARLSRLADAIGGIAEFELLTAPELGLAFGREFAIHAALDAGGFAQRVRAEMGRLAGLRAPRGPGGSIDEEPAEGRTGKTRPAPNDLDGNDLDRNDLDGNGPDGAADGGADGDGR